VGEEAGGAGGGGDASEIVGEWRPMAAAPIAGRTSAASAWTGRELVIWGGIVPLSGAGSQTRIESPADGHRLDPS